MKGSRVRTRACLVSRALAMVACAAGMLAGCSLSDDFEYRFADGGQSDAQAADAQIDGTPPDGASPDASGEGGVECTLSTDCGPGMRCIRGDCVTPPAPPTGLFQTHGGGVTQTDRHRMRISIGFPQPPNGMATRSDHFEVRLGPLGPQP